MGLRRYLPVPLVAPKRAVLRRAVSKFVRPYLLLILGSAILLSLFVVRENYSAGDVEAVVFAPPNEGEGGMPYIEGFWPQEPVRYVATPQTERSTAVEATPTLTATPKPTATLEPTATPEPTLEIAPLNNTTNVLILGSDQRADQPNWRTDVIILLMMNPDLEEAAIVSFPRDMYIDPIPDHLPNRINVIDFLGELDAPGGGGPRLLRSILEDRLGITIEHYVRFRFQGFIAVIDALGGLKIHVDCHLYEHYPEEGIYLNLAPGEHLLTGQQALSYVRSRRSGGGDLERARRQQRVLWALRKQLVDQNLLPSARGLYEALRYSVDTDVGLWDALKYARFAISLDETRVKGQVLSPPDALRPSWRQEMAVFLVDWRYIASDLQRIFDQPPLVETNTASEPGRPQPDDSGVSSFTVTECP
jgi:LCP family protein required for cell wall assembly